MKNILLIKIIHNFQWVYILLLRMILKWRLFCLKSRVNISIMRYIIPRLSTRRRKKGGQWLRRESQKSDIQKLKCICALIYLDIVCHLLFKNGVSFYSIHKAAFELNLALQIFTSCFLSFLLFYISWIRF